MERVEADKLGFEKPLRPENGEDRRQQGRSRADDTVEPQEQDHRHKRSGGDRHQACGRQILRSGDLEQPGDHAREERAAPVFPVEDSGAAGLEPAPCGEQVIEFVELSGGVQQAHAEGKGGREDKTRAEPGRHARLQSDPGQG